MYYGHYFRLDTEASNIGRGIAVFRYCPDENMYLTFSPDEVEFLLVSDGKNPENSLFLRIPLDESLEHSFATTIAENFNSEELFERNKKRTFDENAYTTSFFFDQTKGLKEPEKELGTPPDKEQKQPKQMKLILDFLFDLQETRIFQISPHYRELTEKLHENFFSRCLCAKAKYCHERERYARLRKDLRADDGSTDKEKNVKRKFYGEIYFKAEEEWTECLRDFRFDKISNDSNGWFAPNEEEMKRIYKPWLPLRLDAKNKEKKDANDKLSAQWFVRRYSGTFPLWVSFSHFSFGGLYLLLPRIIFSTAAAWFSLVFVENTNIPESFPIKANIYLFDIVIIILIFSCSWISIKKAAPFAKRGIFGMSFRSGMLTIRALFYSFLLGSGLIFILDSQTLLFGSRPFGFFWISAAFVGMVFQLFLADQNPSDPL